MSATTFIVLGIIATILTTVSTTMWSLTARHMFLLVALAFCAGATALFANAGIHWFMGLSLITSVAVICAIASLQARVLAW